MLVAYSIALLLRLSYANEKIFLGILKQFEINAKRKIAERNAWLGPLHNEKDTFLAIRPPLLWYLFQPLYPCPWDFEKNPSCTIAHDGGKWVCGLHAIEKHIPRISPCIVYSFGSQGNFYFERAILLSAPSCEIFTFDPTWKPSEGPAENGVYSGSKTDERPYTKYIGSFGLSNIDSVGRSALGFPTKRMETIINIFNHSHVDILKIDIEGSEWLVLRDIDWRIVKAGQLLIEFHPSSLKLNVSYLLDVFNKLESHGYYLTGIEPVTMTDLGQVELTFLNSAWRPSGLWAQASPH